MKFGRRDILERRVGRVSQETGATSRSFLCSLLAAADVFGTSCLPDVHVPILVGVTGVGAGGEGLARETDEAFVREVARAVEARREGMVRLLQDLVRVPSVTGEEGAVQEVVERAFRERSLDVDCWEATAEEIEP